MKSATARSSQADVVEAPARSETKGMIPASRRARDETVRRQAMLQPSCHLEVRPFEEGRVRVKAEP